MEEMIDKYMKCTSGVRGSSSATFSAQEQLQPQNHVRLLFNLIRYYLVFYLVYIIEIFYLSFGIDC